MEVAKLEDQTSKTHNFSNWVARPLKKTGRVQNRSIWIESSRKWTKKVAKDKRKTNNEETKVHIQIKEDYLKKDRLDALDTLKYFCLDNQGLTPILLHVPTENDFVKIKAGDEFNVNAKAATNIKKLSCVEKVWVN